MGAGPDEVKVSNVLRFIMRTEPGALSKYRFERKARTSIGVQRRFEIEGCEHPFGNYAVDQTRKIMLVQKSHDLIPKRFCHLRPINATLLVRHGYENIEAITS